MHIRDKVFLVVNCARLITQLAKRIIFCIIAFSIQVIVVPVNAVVILRRVIRQYGGCRQAQIILAFVERNIVVQRFSLVFNGQCAIHEGYQIVALNLRLSGSGNSFVFCRRNRTVYPDRVNSGCVAVTFIFCRLFTGEVILNCIISKRTSNRCFECRIFSTDIVRPRLIDHGYSHSCRADCQIASHIADVVVGRRFAYRRAARHDLTRVRARVGLLPVQRDARQSVPALQAAYFYLLFNRFIYRIDRVVFALGFAVIRIGLILRCDRQVRCTDGHLKRVTHCPSDRIVAVTILELALIQLCLMRASILAAHAGRSRVAEQLRIEPCVFTTRTYCSVVRLNAAVIFLLFDRAAVYRRHQRCGTYNQRAIGNRVVIVRLARLDLVAHSADIRNARNCCAPGHSVVSAVCDCRVSLALVLRSAVMGVAVIRAIVTHRFDAHVCRCDRQRAEVFRDLVVIRVHFAPRNRVGVRFTANVRDRSGRFDAYGIRFAFNQSADLCRRVRQFLSVVCSAAAARCHGYCLRVHGHRHRRGAVIIVAVCRQNLIRYAACIRNARSAGCPRFVIIRPILDGRAFRYFNRRAMGRSVICSGIPFCADRHIGLGHNQRAIGNRVVIVRLARLDLVAHSADIRNARNCCAPGHSVVSAVCDCRVSLALVLRSAVMGVAVIRAIVTHRFDAHVCRCDRQRAEVFRDLVVIRVHFAPRNRVGVRFTANVRDRSGRFDAYGIRFAFNQSADLCRRVRQFLSVVCSAAAARCHGYCLRVHGHRHRRGAVIIVAVCRQNLIRYAACIRNARSAGCPRFVIIRPILDGRAFRYFNRRAMGRSVICSGIPFCADRHIGLGHNQRAIGNRVVVIRLARLDLVVHSTDIRNARSCCAPGHSVVSAVCDCRVGLALVLRSAVMGAAVIHVVVAHCFDAHISRSDRQRAFRIGHIIIGRNSCDFSPVRCCQITLGAVCHIRNRRCSPQSRPNSRLIICIQCARNDVFAVQRLSVIGLAVRLGRNAQRQRVIDGNNSVAIRDGNRLNRIVAVNSQVNALIGCYRFAGSLRSIGSRLDLILSNLGLGSLQIMMNCVIVGTGSFLICCSVDCIACYVSQLRIPVIKSVILVSSRRFGRCALRQYDIFCLRAVFVLGCRFQNTLPVFVHKGNRIGCYLAGIVQIENSVCFSSGIVQFVDICCSDIGVVRRKRCASQVLRDVGINRISLAKPQTGNVIRIKNIIVYNACKVFRIRNLNETKLNLFGSRCIFACDNPVCQIVISVRIIMLISGEFLLGNLILNLLISANADRIGIEHNLFIVVRVSRRNNIPNRVCRECRRGGTVRGHIDYVVELCGICYILRNCRKRFIFIISVIFIILPAGKLVRTHAA